MNRRAFVTGLGAVLAAPLAAEAQQARKMYRIGLLYAQPPSRSSQAAFDERMEQLGWVHGRDFVTEHLSFDGQYERERELASELIRSGPPPPRGCGLLACAASRSD